jgi:hypothetical protein
MAESPDATPDEAPPASRRRKWILPVLAALAVAAALVAWMARTGTVADAFRTAIQRRDAPSLVRLARLPERSAVLAQAKTIWKRCAPESAENAPPPPGACQVHSLTPSIWDRLAGRRDLLVLARDPKTGRRIDVFYYRIRANHLKAGAAPRRFDELEAMAARLLVQP